MAHCFAERADLSFRSTALAAIDKAEKVTGECYAGLRELLLEAKKHEMNDETFILANDCIYDFWKEFEPKFVWNFLPFDFLHSLYFSWRTSSDRRGRAKNITFFMKRLKELISLETDSAWFVTPNAVSIKNKITQREPLVAKYDLVNWKKPDYMLTRRHRGLMRRFVISAEGMQQVEYFKHLRDKLRDSQRNS